LEILRTVGKDVCPLVVVFAFETFWWHPIWRTDLKKRKNYSGVNSINVLWMFFHESTLIFYKKKQFDKNIPYSIKVQNKLKLPVIFSIFMINHKIKIHNYLNRIVFMDFMSLDSWNECRVTFMKIHKNMFMSIYRIDPRVCHGFRLTKWDDYFWVDFDHFWIKQYFWRQLGQYWKLFQA